MMTLSKKMTEAGITKYMKKAINDDIQIL